MGNETLTTAVRALQKFIASPMLTDEDLSVLSPTNAKPLPGASLGLTQFMTDRIVNVSTGGRTAQAIAKDISDYLAGSSAQGPSADQAAVDQLLQIWTSKNKLQPANTIAAVMGADVPRLSIIQVNTIQVTPAARDVDAAVLLLNMVPTIELSRAQPFLTIDVQVGRKPVSTDKRLLGLSQLKFLMGALDVSSSPGNESLANALVGSSEDTTLSGMELFTSPQSLVNPDPALDAGRAGPVLDRFRPLMSIERLNIEITPQVGFFAYRTADLDLTLHDRSRMPEIADFIRPDLYGNTELLIEYGWSHPDTSGNNAFADLLNAMRVREKYGIVNSSFNMTRSGEVKVKLRLFTKGMSDVRVVVIGSEKAKAAVEAIRDLQKAIAEIRAKTSLENEKANKEVRGEMQLFAHSEDIGSSLELDAATRAQLVNFLRQKVKTGDLQSFQAALKNLYGPDGKGNPAVKEKINTISRAVKEKFDVFRLASKGSDPFIKSATAALNKVPELGKANLIQKNHVSLGRLFAEFVGKPLAAQSDRYEDVQLIFYPFNAKAGAAANLNIAEFFIDVNELEQGLQIIARTRGVQLSLQEFLQYIANNFVQDQSNVAYGLSQFYRNGIDPKTGVRTPSQGKGIFKDATRLAREVENRLLKIGSQDGTFKMPELDLIIETVPLDPGPPAPTSPGAPPGAIPVPQSQSASAAGIRTVLKIHFYDRCSTAYESLGQLLLANREEDLRTLGNLPPQDANEHGKLARAWIAKAQKVGLLVPNVTTGAQPAKTGNQGLNRLDTPGVPLQNVYDVKFDIEKLRAFLRSNMPSLVYGTNNTGMRDAAFATMQNQLFATVNMMRAGEQGPVAPAGLSRANLPLRTLPARVSMTSVGCPLLHFMQQFFIDFNTNTTIDNIYGANKLSHEIAPGRFETKVEFVPLDAYGRYENLSTQVGAMLKKLDQVIKDAAAT